MRRYESTLAVAAALLGVLLLGLGAASYLLQLHMTSFTGYALLAGVALLIGCVILDPQAAVALVTRRRSRYAGLSLVATVAFIALLVLVNVIASRGSAAWDLTRAHLNTLAPQSAAAARRLDSDLVITGFYTAQNQQARQDEADLLSLYQAQNRHVQVRFLDPSKSGALVSQLGVHEDGSVVMQYHGKSQVLLPGSNGEQDITSTLLSFESNRTPIVCWAAGDGERDLADTDQFHGYSMAAAELGKNNLKTQDLVLPPLTSIPGSCDAVAIFGPRRALSASSIAALNDYLGRGGRLLVAVDAWPDPATLASVNRVLQPYSLAFDGGLVVDAQSAQGDQTTPVAVAYGASPITKGLNRLYSAFPQTGGIQVGSGAVTPTSIVSSSGNSYEVPKQRQDLTRQRQDRGGPLTLMASADHQSGKQDARVVAVGTGNFADNQVLSSPIVNVQLFTGSLQWLTNQQNLISLPPRPSRVQSLALTDDQARFNLLFTLVVLPLLVGAGGLLVWYRRRSTPVYA